MKTRVYFCRAALQWEAQVPADNCHRRGHVDQPVRDQLDLDLDLIALRFRRRWRGWSGHRPLGAQVTIDRRGELDDSLVGSDAVTAAYDGHRRSAGRCKRTDGFLNCRWFGRGERVHQTDQWFVHRNRGRTMTCPVSRLAPAFPPPIFHPLPRHGDPPVAVSPYIILRECQAILKRREKPDPARPYFRVKVDLEGAHCLTNPKSQRGFHWRPPFPDGEALGSHHRGGDLVVPRRSTSGQRASAERAGVQPAR